MNASSWSGNRWTVEQLTEKGQTVYVARNQRDGRIANGHRHDSREQPWETCPKFQREPGADDDKGES